MTKIDTETLRADEDGEGLTIELLKITEDVFSVGYFPYMDLAEIDYYNTLVDAEKEYDELKSIRIAEDTESLE